MKTELDRLREEWISVVLDSPADRLERYLRQTWNRATDETLRLLTERIKQQVEELIRRQAH